MFYETLKFRYNKLRRLRTPTTKAEMLELDLFDKNICREAFQTNCVSLKSFGNLVYLFCDLVFYNNTTQ